MDNKRELTAKQKQIARYAKAMGHPVRVAIIEMLLDQKCCFHGDMSEVIPVAKSTLSQHLKELKEAGIIQGTIHLPNVKYCVNKDNWKLLQALFGELFKGEPAANNCDV